MTDSTSLLRSLLFGLIAMFVVALLTAVGRRASQGPKGWRRIEPSALHWTALILSGALALMMAYVYLFVGSSRPDGPQQMRILFWLMLAFSVGTCIAALQIGWLQRVAVCWRGDMIEFGPKGRRQRRSLGAVVEARNDWLGRVKLSFDDAAVLAIDPYARGAEQLLEGIEDAKRR
jgi:hypothetical protein